MAADIKPPESNIASVFNVLGGIGLIGGVLLIMAGLAGKKGAQVTMGLAGALSSLFYFAVARVIQGIYQGDAVDDRQLGTQRRPAMIRSLTRLLVAGCVGAAAVLHAADTQVSGQIFIITNGHESVKLGLVPVAAFDYQEITKAIEDVRAKVAPEARTVQELLPSLRELKERSNALYERSSKEFIASRIKLEQLRPHISLKVEAESLYEGALQHPANLASSATYFDHLPPPLATTKSDADGNFVITVPSDRGIVIGATTERQTLRSTESYHWLVRLTAPVSKLMLSNDNMMSEHSEDSVLQAAERGPRMMTTDAILKKASTLREQFAQLSGTPLLARSELPVSKAAPPTAAPTPAPATVTLRQPVKVRVKYGEVTLPAGMKLSVRARDPKTISALYYNDTIQIPVSAVVEQ